MWMVLGVMFSNTYKHTFGARWVWKGAAAEMEEGQYQMHTPAKNKKKRINTEERRQKEGRKEKLGRLKLCRITTKP